MQNKGRCTVGVKEVLQEITNFIQRAVPLRNRTIYDIVFLVLIKTVSNQCSIFKARTSGQLESNNDYSQGQKYVENNC